MDKNRIEGAVKQVKGSIKEAIGKVTGDRTTQAEGVAEKTAGKVQSNVGKVSDAVKDQLKK
ncbi:CsbD family protein [Burkholderia plantarii]|uniref:CsbD family protein n=1 Tax=Burkholderia plantarii TaxID=41899 RepID=UPI0018DD9AA2|nr:CsbD family protein [Burkholderia plantarii]MBI0331758.1 CsbD family protein [Burkholderia plantarii]